MKVLAALMGMLMVLGWALPARAQAPDAPAIRATIERQLDAMQRGDAGAAFAIASPAIQGMFGDSATFMRMVQQGYPQIYQSRRHSFLNLDTGDGKVIQRVLIESEVGSVIARYEMVSIDGQWRINGCSVEKAEEA